jgi:hypothetical protein
LVFRARASLPWPGAEVFVPAAVGQRGQFTGPGVEARQRQMGEVDGIGAILNRQQADGFTPQHLGEKNIVLVPAEMSVAFMVRTSMVSGYSTSVRRAG